MARESWLAEDGQSTIIDDKAKNLASFVEAMADGHVDDQEVAAQEKRVIEAMQAVEPMLDDAAHAKVTELLCELSAFSVMQVLHELHEARMAASTTKFRG
ncbi:MAG: hypothetical protein KDB14_03975 [Planctomycetales bacterium]|nr:hypothetical protein [Planctomycetales bacterium]